MDDRLLRHWRLHRLLAESLLAEPFDGAVLVAGACLVVAALAVKGETFVNRAERIGTVASLCYGVCAGFEETRKWQIPRSRSKT